VPGPGTRGAAAKPRSPRASDARRLTIVSLLLADLSRSRRTCGVDVVVPSQHDADALASLTVFHRARASVPATPYFNIIRV